MYHKNRRYRRYQRRRAIARKNQIVLNCMSSSPDERYGYWSALGKLNKGKVHCSCPLCTCKSTKDRGKTTNSYSGYSHSDLQKLNSMLYQIVEDLLKGDEY